MGKSRPVFGKRDLEFMSWWLDAEKPMFFNSPQVRESLDWYPTQCAVFLYRYVEKGMLTVAINPPVVTPETHGFQLTHEYSPTDRLDELALDVILSYFNPNQEKYFYRR